MLAQVEVAAPSGTSVLMLGETGTGKELIARAIHNLSPRRERTFVKINCAAIPAGLLESELFGHERGAFTGALTQKIGRFELADRGTLFLDEVGDIPLELQPKLLRVLQEQEFERLGSNRTLRVDVRVVAATNCDLARLVAERKFRSDLYYRLNVFPISIPPLRERPEDVPLLVRYFVQKFSRRQNKTVEYVPADVMDALTHYSWPGNIRELENLIERAVLLSPGKELRIPLSELRNSSPMPRPHCFRRRRTSRRLVRRDAAARRVHRHAGRNAAPAHFARVAANRVAHRRPQRRCAAPRHQAHHAASPHAEVRHQAPHLRIENGKLGNDPPPVFVVANLQVGSSALGRTKIETRKWKIGHWSGDGLECGGSSPLLRSKLGRFAGGLAGTGYDVKARASSQHSKGNWEDTPTPGTFS